MLSSLRPLLAAITLGLAGAGLLAPAPLAAQAAAETRDYECFVLLQERRSGFAANTGMDPAQRAEILNNLTIISAYYAGIISRHPYHQVMTSLAAAQRQLAAATSEQRDLFATQCTNRYIAMLNSLTASSASVAPQG